MNHPIFINCPYDKEYKNILRGMLFALIYFGFEPKLALQNCNSNRSRIDEIVDLIKNTKYSIHDLSRMDSDDETRLSRLNMAFELGIDYAYKDITNKITLILDSKPYRYKISLSDLSGIDIKHHSNDPMNAIEIIRNWVSDLNIHEKVLSANSVCDEYTISFYGWLYDYAVNTLGYNETDYVEKIQLSDFIKYVSQWKNQIYN